MKKFLFGFAALALLATASCKKDDEASGPSNRLTVAGEALAVSSFVPSGSSVSVTAGNSGSNASIVIFTFGTGSATPSSGTYKVVADADAADEVELLVTRASSAGKIYTSQNSSVVVTVGKDGDKMTLSMPDAQVKQEGGTETITVSANAQQL